MSLPWGRTRTLLRGYSCFLTAFPLFLHSLLPPISNCLNLPFGTQGRSRRVNKAFFLQTGNRGHGQDLYSGGPHGVLIHFRKRVVQSEPPRQEWWPSAEECSSLWQPPRQEPEKWASGAWPRLHSLSFPPPAESQRTQVPLMYSCRTASQEREEYGERGRMDLEGHSEEIQSLCPAKQAQILSHV